MLTFIRHLKQNAVNHQGFSSTIFYYPFGFCLFSLAYAHLTHKDLCIKKVDAPWSTSIATFKTIVYRISFQLRK
jgi:hypothetical protein